MASYRLPLVVLALLSAAASVILSAVLMAANAGRMGHIFMLEIHDRVEAYAYEQMADVGLPADNMAVYYTTQPLQRIYFNDSTAPVTRMIDAYLTDPIPESTSRALWSPEQSNTTTAFAIYVWGINETPFSLIEPSDDMIQTARNLGANITLGANLWRKRDQKAFDAIHAFRLRIAGVAVAGAGVVGLAVVAIAHGYLPTYVVGIVSGILVVASICHFVAAGLLTAGLVSLSGTYAPFQFIIPDAIATYRLSSTFLGLTWASAGLVLFATMLIALAAIQDAPSEPYLPRWRGRKAGSASSSIAPMVGIEQPWQPTDDMHVSTSGHKSISAPYSHSDTIDEAAKARGVGVAISSEEPPLPERPSPVASLPPYQQWDSAYASNTSRFSVVSSLGPTPVRTHF